ncbi:MAG: class II glutamine amidotransferase, partial [Bacteroidota bacterium]
EGILQEMEQCPNSLLWLSENGIKSHNPDVRGLHNDGCGMAYINSDGRVKSIRKGKTDFWDKSYHDFAAAVSSKLIIAHNRFASPGLNTIENGAHPFIYNKFGKDYAFCHNGGVDTFMDEAKQRNTSDSEIFMEHLLNNMKHPGKTEVVDSLEKIATTTDYSSLCGFLMCDKNIYIWRIFNEKRKEDFDKLSRYYTLYMSIRSNYILIASEPLDEEKWLLIPNKQFLAISPSDNGIETWSYALNV